MADHRHKRDTNARRMPKAHLVAGPLAFVATATTVGLGLLATDSSARDLIVANSGSNFSTIAAGSRGEAVSRSSSREDYENLQRAFEVNLTRTATLRAIRQADTERWATVDLNLWDSPGRKAEKVGLLKAGKKVLVTGRHTPERVEIVWNDKSRWVTAGYLSEDKPVAGASGDVDATCSNGTTVPAGVSPNIAAVHQAVCANFPEITTYGTFRGDGEHAQGIAVDIMVSGERGWQVAEFVRAHYAELGVSYIIYSQSIWSVDRAGEGWRGMEDRGSTTANHYDHVHVTTY